MSFSKEIRDFISAFSAGQKIMSHGEESEYRRARTDALKKKTERDNDPEMVALDRKYKTARVGAAERANDPRITEARLRVYRANEGRINAVTDYYRGRGGGGALPIGEYGTPSATTDVPAAVPASTPPPEEEGFAQGGYVRGYEDGGIVEDDDVAGGGALDFDSDLDDTGDDVPPMFSYASANEAVQAGMTGAATQAGLMDAKPTSALPGTPDPRRQAAIRMYAMGGGAAPRDQMEAVRRTIDPKGKLSEAERNMAAFASVYDYYVKQGNPRAAQNAAASMVQYYRMTSARYAALAKAAAEGGNMDGALQAALKAYANVPDGRDVKLAKNPDGTVTYSFTDQETGEVVQKGIATPDQLVQQATRLTAGGFDDLLIRAGARQSQGRAQRPGTDKGAKAPTLAERKAASGAISDITYMSDEDDPEQKDKLRISKKFGNEVQHVASQIFRSNDIDAKEAVRMAGKLTDIGAQPDYRLIPSEDRKSVTVRMSDGRELKLSREVFQSIASLRGRIEQKRNDDAGASVFKHARENRPQDQASRLRRQARESKSERVAGREEELRRSRASHLEQVDRNASDMEEQPVSDGKVDWPPMSDFGGRRPPTLRSNSRRQLSVPGDDEE